MKWYKIILLVLLLPLTVAAGPGTDKEEGKSFLFFRTNRFDKEGRFHGRWKVYEDGTDKLVRKGRFRHGQEVGKWKYFYPNGNPMLVEKWKRRKKEILVKRYHENGELKREGKAKMEINATGVRYYWFGDWKVYNEQGEYMHTESYTEGKLVGTLTI